MSSDLESFTELKTVSEWKAFFRKDTLGDQPIETKMRGLKRRNFEYQNQPLPKDCTHQVSAGGLCFVCGLRWNKLPEEEEEEEEEDNNRVPLKYVLDDFSLSRNEIVGFRSMNTEMNLLQKKLILVLDLDNTLLHSIPISDLRNEDLVHFCDLEKEDITHVREFKSILKRGIFFMKKMGTFVKLRPFVVEFLTEVSKMFELYIYTNGSREYADTIANLLDPDEIHFDWRVISRADSVIGGCQEKSLEIVFGEESKVVIVDDKTTVWGKYRKNVIPIDPYCFWEKHRGKMKSMCMKKTKYFSTINYCRDMELEIMLMTLKKLHGLFFNEMDPPSFYFNKGNSTVLMKRDVRLLVQRYYILNWADKF